jgi:hypothetical protein
VDDLISVLVRELFLPLVPFLEVPVALQQRFLRIVVVSVEKKIGFRCTSSSLGDVLNMRV